MDLRIKKLQKKDFSLKEIIFVPYRDFYFVVNMAEIMYIKAEGAYCRIVLRSGKEHLMISRMGVLLDKLPEYFIRIHNSYVVNMCQAHSVHDGKVVKLNNDYEVPISRRKKKEIFGLVTVA